MADPGFPKRVGANSRGVPPNYYYRPQRSCEGYVFTNVCLSTGGVAGHVPPWDQVHPPGPGTPLSGTRYTPWDQVHPPNQVHPQTRYTPPGPGTPPGTRYTPRDQVPPDQVHPPGDGYCCGRYASYWNAFLL